MPPTNYDGLPSNIVPATAINIASSTNTNPIVVTVSGGLPTDFLTGVVVHINGHRTNTAANGVWAATVTGGSTFTIPVAGNGVGAATGTVQPLNLPPFYQIPADGDADNEASIDAWAKRTGDRSSFLAGATGGYKLAKRNVFYRVNSLFGNSSWAAFAAGSAVAGTPAQFTTQGGLSWATSGPGTLNTPGAGIAPQFFLDGVVAGDQIIYDMQTTANFDTTAILALYAAYEAEAVSPSWPANYSAIVGTPHYIVGGGALSSVSLRGFFPSITQTGDLWIQPAVFPLTSSTQSYTLYGDVYMSVEVWRPTSMPQ
jgi:hypothetical protein